MGARCTDGTGISGRRSCSGRCGIAALRISLPPAPPPLEFVFDIVASGLRAATTLLIGAARAAGADTPSCKALAMLAADTLAAATAATAVFAPAASSASERGDR